DPYVEVVLQAPPSPDYIPGPEEPEQEPPSPDYVPGPEHADDEIVAEDQPYAEDASPTGQSPEYAPSAEETEPFETVEFVATPPPHPAYRMTARISIPALVPMPTWEDRLEVTLPPQKRLGIALGPGYEVGESSSTAAARPAGGKTRRRSI
nr:hypothetical protein [Tanacetum cinerariifolium]